MTGGILPRSFYQRDAVTVARDLLGKVLVHGDTAGIIIAPSLAYMEEAYADARRHGWSRGGRAVSRVRSRYRLRAAMHRYSTPAPPLV